MFKKFGAQKIFVSKQFLGPKKFGRKKMLVIKQGDKWQEQAKQGVIFYPNLFP